MMSYLQRLGSLGLLLSLASAQGDDEPARRTWQTKEWDEVLRLASSRSEGSYDELRAIAARDGEAVHGALARKILALWDSKANTFYSPAPRVVHRAAVDRNALERLFPGITTGNLLVLEVEVDASGVPTNVQVTKGPDNPAYRKLVKRSILKSSFCPAKKGDKYVDGRVTLTYALEVR